MEKSKAIDPKAASPDDLTKTTNKGNVELSEEELKKASGGAGDYFLPVKGVTTDSETKDSTFKI